MVTRHRRAALTIGAVLPAGSHVARATVNGHRVGVRLVRTSRGLEATVALRAGRGTSTLVITTR